MASLTRGGVTSLGRQAAGPLFLEAARVYHGGGGAGGREIDGGVAAGQRPAVRRSIRIQQKMDGLGVGVGKNKERSLVTGKFCNE